MKNIIRFFPVILISLLMAFAARAEKVQFKSGQPSEIKSTAAGCLPGSQFKYLELNNVRCRINTGGDMWWDFESSQYEIPKGSKKMSMFSAALWIGGIDANGQLKLAAQRYRQVGVDFWPGPLTTDGTAAISTETCAAHDKIYYITRSEVDDFNAWWDDKASKPNYQIPSSILEWPAHGDESLGQSYYLAPFFDRNGDGVYDPVNDGDYPYYDMSNELCHTKTPTAEGNGILVDQVIKGDATLWWVFNDKGNIHTETKGQPIGLEIRAQAFAFATNDEINNMTFYSYEIINRSTYRLTNTYFSQWVDTDLGYAYDDYVGCDVMRGLGYCYNGTQVDGNGQAWAYGDQPPAIGVDFFQGPYLDPDGFDNPSFKPVYDATGKILQGPTFFSNCDMVLRDSTMASVTYTIDSLGSPKDSMNVFVNAAAINGVNFGNGIVDDERFGMRRFVYHNNNTSGVPAYMTDPETAPQYYNFLRSIWKDGTQMLYGGNGHLSSGATGPECYFMFPGESDICNWGTRGVIPSGSKKWTEVTAGNQPGDRRFMESAGPFTLEPGAVNYITVGIPWARAVSGGPEASVRLLQSVDDKCQMLFDNCFKVISGPNAPDLTIRELENELLIYITNRKTNDAGNNFHEGYKELDPRIQPPPGDYWDPYYRFEGYQIYQLKNSNVTIADITNNALARQVFQCDIKNGVSRIINFNFDLTLGASVPVEEVNGLDKGIQHSFALTKDAFTGDALVNHTQYYFLAISYAYNNYKTYIPTVAQNLNGQQQPYLPGRKNIKVYTGIPHAPIGPVAPKGTCCDGVVVTRIAGQGNGGNYLELSEASIADILSKKPADSVNVYGSPDYPCAYNLTYQLGKGPISVKVIDPLNVKDATYTVAFDSMFNVIVPVGSRDTAMPTTRWKLIDAEGQVFKSDTTIDLVNEQMFVDLGLSVSMSQTLYPGPYIPESGKYNPMLLNNGILGGSITYGDSTSNWLRFIQDVDGGGSYNWIRSGVQTDPDARNNDWDAPDKPFDPDQKFEKLVGGTWAPYMLTSCVKQDTAGPSYGDPIAKLSRNDNFFTDVASVDIVFTADKSKWTRSAIIEMSPYQDLAEGKAKQFDLRNHRSVNQDGDTAVVSSDPAKNSDYISAYGMGWFPGYAINLETGERLNIVFGEDSHLLNDNGRDMLFNPSSRRIDENGRIVFGGKHYIYVMAHTFQKEKKIVLTPSSPIKAADINAPAYDAEYHFVKEMGRTFTASIYLKQLRAYLFANTMWVSIPIANPNDEWLSTDITVKLRITKPYDRYFSAPMTGDFVASRNANNFWPMYSFSTSGVATVLDSTSKSISDLDKINMVPNPYKGYADYETDQLDNRVKIVNLPQKCTISIYSTGGSLIRTFNKDESKTYIDWDLKNFAGIPIAGGVYIVHVKVPGVGEKVVKWFGALRQVDFNGF